MKVILCDLCGERRHIEQEDDLDSYSEHYDGTCTTCSPGRNTPEEKLLAAIFGRDYLPRE